jgi:hypothetical protein
MADGAHPAESESADREMLPTVLCAEQRAGIPKMALDTSSGG